MKRPLSFSGTGPGQPKGPVPRRFSVLPAIGGFEVIDHDGRAVDACELSTEAEAVALALNEAASAGARAIAHRIERL